MSQATKSGSLAGGQAAGSRRRPAVCLSVHGITAELCIELCSKDASCVYTFCNYKTSRQGVGRGVGVGWGRAADFIVMALMKMLLQSFWLSSSILY